jgi:hypothetical protein
MDLYGTWQEYCTVTYHANFPGGTGTGTAPVDTASPHKALETVTVLDGGTLAKSRWELTGWNTQPNGKGASYKAGDTLIITEDMHLYATWKQKRSYYDPVYVEPAAIHDAEVPLATLIPEHFAYIVGYPDGNVRPEHNISRAEVATTFFRLLTDEIRSLNWTRKNPYPDVVTDNWFCSAVSVMNEMGMIKGYPDGEFKPNNPVTRAELAAIASRFAREREIQPINNLTFSDVAGHWAEDDIQCAAAAGWINGYPDGTFKPDQHMTRAELMTLVNRMLERAPETADDLLRNGMINWPDNADPAKWYYLAVQEATNSHVPEYKGKTVPGSQYQYESWVKMIENRDWAEIERSWVSANRQ